MPSNWLRDRCWLEDPQPPRPKEPRPQRTRGQASKSKGGGRRKKQRKQPHRISASPPPKVAKFRTEIGAAIHSSFGSVSLLTKPTPAGFIEFYAPGESRVRTAPRSSFKDIRWLGEDSGPHVAPSVPQRPEKLASAARVAEAPLTVVLNKTLPASPVVGAAATNSVSTHAMTPAPSALKSLEKPAGESPVAQAPVILPLPKIEPVSPAGRPTPDNEDSVHSVAPMPPLTPKNIKDNETYLYALGLLD
jgi:hypothetical protein